MTDPSELRKSGQQQTISNLEWALRRVEEWAHAAPALVDALQTPSRLAVVHRLTTSIDGLSRVFYLKEYSTGGIEDEQEFWPNLKRLQSASAAFAGDPNLAPLEIVAIEDWVLELGSHRATTLSSRIRLTKIVFSVRASPTLCPIVSHLIQDG